jgi:hypothetical protein
LPAALFEDKAKDYAIIVDLDRVIFKVTLEYTGAMPMGEGSGYMVSSNT